MNRGNNNQQTQRNYNTPINYDEITCYKCNSKDHFATECLTRNNQRIYRQTGLWIYR